MHASHAGFVIAEPAAGGEAAARVRPIATFVKRHRIALLLALGLAVRLALLAVPRSYYPDQIFQYLEPAHRMVTGSGIVTWESRHGIRSRLLPVLLAGPMWLGAHLAPGTTAYMLLPKIALVLLSLLSIAAAAAIGRQASTRAGWMGAFVIAIWSETALFATQALTEAVALSLFLPAAALLGDARTRDPRRLAAAGMLLAATMVMRFQYAPAVGVFVLFACKRDRMRWAWVVGGGAAGLAAGGLFDAAMGQAPFGWALASLRENIAHGRASGYSTDGPLYYPLAFAANWGIWLLPIWLLARLGAKRQPALMACALANIAAHTLIAHKEYRFVLLSSVLLILLAAIGTVDAIAAARTRRYGRFALPVAIAGWLLASVTTALLPGPASSWSKATPWLEAYRTLGADPHLCGVAVAADWTGTGGYTYLHRNVPIYVDYTPEKSTAWVRRAGGAFDTIVAPIGEAPNIPAPYARTDCFDVGGRFPDDNACIFHRPGRCDPSVARRYELNTVLARVDR